MTTWLVSAGIAVDAARASVDLTGTCSGVPSAAAAKRLATGFGGLRAAVDASGGTSIPSTGATKCSAGWLGIGRGTGRWKGNDRVHVAGDDDGNNEDDEGKKRRKT